MACQADEEERGENEEKKGWNEQESQAFSASKTC